MIIDSEILQYFGSSIYFSLIKLEKKKIGKRERKTEGNSGVRAISKLKLLKLEGSRGTRKQMN